MNASFDIGQIAILCSVVTSYIAVIAHNRQQRNKADDDATRRNKELRDESDRNFLSLKQDNESSTRELKAEIEKHNDGVEDRIKNLELTCKDYMPRREIEAKIDHEKNNRVTSDNALKNVIDRNTADITDIRVNIGKMEQQNVGMANNIDDIKMMLKELTKDTGNRLDKIREDIAIVHGRQVA